MTQITQKGATVEEAILQALQTLGCSREEVNIEVLQEAKKGFLGFGARPAEIKVTMIQKEEVPASELEEQSDPEIFDDDVQILEKNISENHQSLSNEPIQSEEAETDIVKPDSNPAETAKEYLQNIAEALNIHDLSVDVQINGRNMSIQLESKKAALLIGRRGSTLNALQHLTQLVVNKASKSFMLVNLDVENYRERRQASLEQLAKRMADKAIYTGRKVVLEPMPSYERKIIHNALANRVDVETYSEGVDPNRHLVIEPIK